MWCLMGIYMTNYLKCYVLSTAWYLINIHLHDELPEVLYSKDCLIFDSAISNRTENVEMFCTICHHNLYLGNFLYLSVVWTTGINEFVHKLC